MQPVPVQPIPVQVVGAPMPGQPIPVQPVAQPMPGQPLPPPPPMPVPVSSAYMPQPPPPVASSPVETHLKVLESVGGLYVKQKAEAFEAITGFETCNRYKVYLTGPDCVRGKDQEAYFKAQEESECCERQFCGNLRSFEMKIYGPDKQPVIILKRPFKCPMIFCNLPELSIEDANGNHIGSVKNHFECCGDKFTIYDKEDMPVLSIHGDCCQWGKVCPMPFGSCAEVRFDILNVATGSAGFIKKIFSGVVKEMLTDADSFVLSFPPDATLQHKMLLLGAVFLIDFMYFENNEKDNKDNLSQIFD